MTIFQGHDIIRLQITRKCDKMESDVLTTVDQQEVVCGLLNGAILSYHQRPVTVRGYAITWHISTTAREGSHWPEMSQTVW